MPAAPAVISQSGATVVVPAGMKPWHPGSQVAHENQGGVDLLRFDRGPQAGILIEQHSVMSSAFNPAGADHCRRCHRPAFEAGASAARFL